MVESVEKLTAPERTRWISIEEVESQIDDQLDDDFLRECVKFIFSLENYIITQNGKKGYEIETEGTYRGLGQFRAGIWNSLYRNHGLDYPFTSVGLPAADIQATALLVKDSMRYYRKKFGHRLDDKEIVYLFHNQGASGAYQWLTGQVSSLKGRQSKKAQALFAGMKASSYALTSTS